MIEQGYAVINVDDEIRKSSSSGAVFYELAAWVIANRGVVFGAKFDDMWSVTHDYAENMVDVKAFLGSKYVQSRLGNTYQNVKKFLQDDRYVLFTGTPCQINGLKCFLGKEYEKLFTVDFICHGVPSRAVWREYLKYQAKNREIKSINFRDKTKGWNEYSIKIDYLDETSYACNHHKNIYMQGFLQNIYLRPACYECKFKGINRAADLTMADFWGIEDILPEMDDNKGVSLLIVHTKAGEIMMQEVAKRVRIKELNLDKALEINASFYKSAEKNPKRDKFYQNNSFNFEMLKGLVTPSVLERAKYTFRRVRTLIK